MKAAMPSCHSAPPISMASASRPMFLAEARSASPHIRTAIFDCATARAPSRRKRRASSIAARHQFLRRMHAGEEAMRQRFRRRDMAAQQDPLHRLAAPDQTMKFLHTTGAGERADAYLRHADFGVVRHQSEIAGEGHLTAAAQGKAVDSRDDGDRQGLDPIEQGRDRLKIPVAQREAATSDSGVFAGEIAQMRAGAERPALPGDDQRSRATRDACGQRGIELIEQLKAQRVHLALADHGGKRDIRLRPAQRDGVAGRGGLVGCSHGQNPCRLLLHRRQHEPPAR